MSLSPAQIVIVQLTFQQRNNEMSDTNEDVGRCVCVSNVLSILIVWYLSQNNISPKHEV